MPSDLSASTRLTPAQTRTMPDSDRTSTPRGATASTLPPVPSVPNELLPQVRTLPSRNATTPTATSLASRSRPGSGDGVRTGGMSFETPPKASRVGGCAEGAAPHTTHEPSACRAADIDSPA